MHIRFCFFFGTFRHLVIPLPHTQVVPQFPLDGPPFDLVEFLQNDGICDYSGARQILAAGVTRTPTALLVEQLLKFRSNMQNRVTFFREELAEAMDKLDKSQDKLDNSHLCHDDDCQVRQWLASRKK